jgi:glutamate-1-semialdehyde 2,1-aminomutase
MGCIPPLSGYLEGLREVTATNGALLIFDEVMTGFRVARGGAQARYGITPDLTTLGKIIGGGLPVGAFGGRADVMSHIAPEGNVYQAGTLSGNPLATVAGLTMLNALTDDVYVSLAERTDYLCAGLRKAAERNGVSVSINQVCGMFSIFFTSSAVSNFDHVANSNTAAFNRFFHAMLDEGVYLAPSAFETGFVSTAHSQQLLDATIAAADNALASV